MQLQKHMNRLFTNMTADKPVYRHNFNFTFKGAHTAALLHENPCEAALMRLHPVFKRG